MTRESSYYNDAHMQDMQESGRDLTRLYSEFRRKQQMIFSVWTALDTKIGILLGLIVVVLLEITVNTEVLDSVVANYILARPLPYTPLVTNLANYSAYLLFWLAFGLLFFATITGVRALRSKRFEDIETVDEADLFINNRSMTNEIFINRMVWYPYIYVQANEIHAKEKSRSIKLMVILIFSGISAFVIRFLLLFSCRC